MPDGGYHNLDVYKLAHGLAVRIHKASLSLPKFELYEEGAQIRRSSKRVSASIVEGFALRKYKALYLSYLYRALASADETQKHISFIRETDSLRDEAEFKALTALSVELSRKLAKFIQSVGHQHGAPRYLDANIITAENAHSDLHEGSSEIRNQKSEIRNQKSEITSR